MMLNWDVHQNYPKVATAPNPCMCTRSYEESNIWHKVGKDSFSQQEGPLTYRKNPGPCSLGNGIEV
jgi:hypothetical protein